ncbi:MAG: hypothetical protein ACREQK_06420 [Candidatus Binatia bacterium]
MSREMRGIAGILVAGFLVLSAACEQARAQAGWQSDWEKTLAAARNEGKVVVGVPPSAELRKQMEAAFKARFGFEIELFSATGPQIANRIVSESKAGAWYFDAFIFGSCTGVALIRSGVFDQIEPYMSLSIGC